MKKFVKINSRLELQEMNADGQMIPVEGAIVFDVAQFADVSGTFVVVTEGTKHEVYHMSECGIVLEDLTKNLFEFAVSEENFVIFCNAPDSDYGNFLYYANADFFLSTLVLDDDYFIKDFVLHFMSQEGVPLKFNLARGKGLDLVVAMEDADEYENLFSPSFGLTFSDEGNEVFATCFDEYFNVQEKFTCYLLEKLEGSKDILCLDDDDEAIFFTEDGEDPDGNQLYSVEASFYSLYNDDGTQWMEVYTSYIEEADEEKVVIAYDNGSDTFVFVIDSNQYEIDESDGAFVAIIGGVSNKFYLADNEVCCIEVQPTCE